MDCSDTTKSNASACGLAITPSLAVRPGATALTVMPCTPTSVASDRVKAKTAPLEDT